MTLPQALIAGLPTTSAKIRALAASGMERAEIARFLKIKYQHVRSVLVQNDSLPQCSRHVSAHPKTQLVEEVVASPCYASNLAKAGFAVIGKWQLCHKNGMRVNEDLPPDSGVYAFLVDDCLYYIGVTQRGIKSRLDGYARGYERQTTNARIKKLICHELTIGRAVTIMAAFPPDIEWNNLPINGAAGLEYGMIRRFRPPWNQLGA